MFDKLKEIFQSHGVVVSAVNTSALSSAVDTFTALPDTFAAGVITGVTVVITLDNELDVERAALVAGEVAEVVREYLVAVGYGNTIEAPKVLH